MRKIDEAIKMKGMKGRRKGKKNLENGMSSGESIAKRMIADNAPNVR